jgi:hypothetical protein
LDPSIKRGPWSLEEDQLLLQAHRDHGSKWSVIARSLPGRTDNSIKNRWNSALRRELRKINRAAEDAELGRADDDTILSPIAPISRAPQRAAISGTSSQPHDAGHALEAADASMGADDPHTPLLSSAPPSLAAAPLPQETEVESSQRALCSELAALGDGSCDDETKRALRARLIEQLRELNATWERAGATPSANHIQVRA